MEFAIVKAGHDKGQIYLVDKVESEYVYLVNGTTKPFDKPKKKNRKHIQPVKNFPQDITLIMEENVPQDQKVKKAIKCLQAHINSQTPNNGTK